MKAVSRWLDRFCYDHPNFGIPNLMKYIVIGNVMVYFLDLFSRVRLPGCCHFQTADSPGATLAGNFLHLCTYFRGFVLWFVMTTLFYYYIGNALERQWGTTRFTVFYGLGVLPQYHHGLCGWGGTSMYCINMSMFFAFATLYPEMEVLLMGILPIKVKWLAWLDAAMFAFDIFFSIFSASGSRRSCPWWPC